MIISLLGYMGSGKSHFSKNLSKKLNFPLIDLDQKISEENLLSIAEIFQTKGEIFFRKEEKRVLENILNEEKDIILSLGGGTPVYYSNMDLINEKSKSIFPILTINPTSSIPKIGQHSRADHRQSPKFQISNKPKILIKCPIKNYKLHI